jgi:hypothetical protein
VRENRSPEILKSDFGKFEKKMEKWKIEKNENRKWNFTKKSEKHKSCDFAINSENEIFGKSL